MLAVGRALMSRPKIIMMDEPSLGLAPIVVKGIFDIIKEINRMGVTVLLIEQNANMALRIADIGYVLETGTITDLPAPGQQLLNDPRHQGGLSRHLISKKTKGGTRKERGPSIFSRKNAAPERGTGAALRGGVMRGCQMSKRR